MLPSNLILFRTLNSAHFELNLYLGPTPHDIIQQIRGDYSIKVPPFWALGVHICKNSVEKNLTIAADDVEELLTANQVPFDSHCLHENILEFGDSELTERLWNVVTQLHDDGKKVLLSLVSQVSIFELQIFDDVHIYIICQI